MRSTSILAAWMAAAAAAFPAAGAEQANKFKLKPGASGQVCLDCHADFQATLKKPFVHTPVKSKDCIGCHNPHSSDHGKLLAEEPSQTCSACHGGVVPEGAKSVHKALADKGCTGCHDPHASGFKFNLAKPGNDLCATCHKKVVEGATKAKFKHRPVEQGCVTCHDPHGSAKAEDLLKLEVPGLCVKCHKTEGTIFAKQHMGYPVGKARCTSCHDPHGSDKRGMLFDKVHAPVAKGMCSQCHEPPGSPNKFKPRVAGVDLCRGCHSQQVTQILDKGRVHRPVVQGQACLSCHNPHASREPKLLAADMVVVCGKCHADTIKRQALAPTKHPPVEEGSCTSCHDPHSSDIALALTQASMIEMCGTCHDWQKHATHPVGEKVKDPRNRNLRLDCLSCHRAHGTEYKHMLTYATQTEMCTKCHESFKR